MPQLTTELILSGVTCAVDEQSMPPSPESPSFGDSNTGRFNPADATRAVTFLGRAGLLIHTIWRGFAYHISRSEAKASSKRLGLTRRNSSRRFVGSSSADAVLLASIIAASHSLAGACSRVCEEFAETDVAIRKETLILRQIR